MFSISIYEHFRVFRLIKVDLNKLWLKEMTIIRF